MRYSKKRRYRKKQRGGNETRTEFSYPESDMAYAQIYSLIKNEELRKSVIEEMTKGDEILFTSRDLALRKSVNQKMTKGDEILLTSRDLALKISPGILDIDLYKFVVETAEKEVYNVNPHRGSENVSTAIPDLDEPYTFERFKKAFFNKKYNNQIFNSIYNNQDNFFLRHLIEAFYNVAEKTLAPALQEKAFLKELFTNDNDKHKYIDDVFSLNVMENNNIILVVQNGIVNSIVFKKDAGITNNKLADLDKLKGLKKITIQDDITKYSAIKSTTVEDVIIETDTLSSYDQLSFLNMCPALKNITIKSKDLNGNIDAVLNKLPSGESKNMVDLKGSSALTSGNITDIVNVIKDKKITCIAFPNQMTKFITDNNIALSEALKPRFLKSVFGQSVSVSTEKINDTLIKKYSELETLFPGGFKIEEVSEGNDVKYTVYNGNEVGGQPVCEFTTTAGDDTENSRNLQTINFKKGIKQVVLTNFNDLTQVSIDQDVELTEISITNCTNEGFNVVLSKTEGDMTTSQPSLQKIVITGCSKNDKSNKNNIFNLTNLDLLTEVNIDLLSICELVLLGCKKLTKVIELPKFLNRLEINDAPILKLDFLNSLETLMVLNLKGCTNFKEFNLINKGLLTRLHLNECISLQNLTLNGYSGLEILEVKAPQIKVIKFGDFIYTPKQPMPPIMTLSQVEINDCTKIKTLELPPSVKNLVITQATVLEDISFLSKLKSLNSLTIDNCQEIKSINCNAFEKIVQYIVITNCKNLNIFDSNNNNTIYFTNYTRLTNLTIQDTACTAVVLSNCQSLDTLNLDNNSITDYTVDNLPVIQELTIPDTVTSIKAETMNSLKTITYTGTVMNSFDVHNCKSLINIPDFKKNTVNMTLLKVSNCPQIHVDLVVYLGDVGGVSGGSKNKSRKVSGGMNNKSRRKKRLLRGGAVESIDKVDFLNTDVTVSDITKLITVITRKKIQKMFVPNLVKPQIENVKFLNDFIDALKTNNSANQPININDITNVEVLDEESYNIRRNAIITGLKGVFTQIAEQERLDNEKVDENREATKV